MLVLALDTATPAVTVGVVELTGAGRLVRAQRTAHDARKHAELLTPSALRVCREAGVRLVDLDAVVVGTGPGPFTGLRVGMVTAAALGDALDIPVHGVCSLDAIAAAGPADRPLLVVTDARRREVYWAVYREGADRVAGPSVDSPAALRARLPDLGVAAVAGAAELIRACDPGPGGGAAPDPRATVNLGAVANLGVHGPAAPVPDGLVAVAATALRSGTAPGPLEPLYLRRPDAAPPAARKPVRTP